MRPSSICSGNRKLRDQGHMEHLAQIAADMENETFIVYKQSVEFQFCKQSEYIGDQSQIVKTIEPNQKK